MRTDDLGSGRNATRMTARAALRRVPPPPPGGYRRRGPDFDRPLSEGPVRFSDGYVALSEYLGGLGNRLTEDARNAARRIPTALNAREGFGGQASPPGARGGLGYVSLNPLLTPEDRATVAAHELLHILDYSTGGRASRQIRDLSTGQQREFARQLYYPSRDNNTLAALAWSTGQELFPSLAQGANYDIKSIAESLRPAYSSWLRPFRTAPGPVMLPPIRTVPRWP